MLRKCNTLGFPQCKRSAAHIEKVMNRKWNGSWQYSPTTTTMVTGPFHSSFLLVTGRHGWQLL